MAVLRLQNFGGQIPMLGDRALPDGFATRSINTWFYGNEMRGIRVQKKVADIGLDTRKFLRLPKLLVGGDPEFPTSVPPPSWIGDDKYVELSHPDTDIVGSAMVEDQYKRWYFCDPINGAYFNTTARLMTTPTSGMYYLGMNGPGYDTPPGTAEPYRPTVAVTGGTGTIMETRAYVYTWVNEFDEETGPSLPSQAAINGLNNATWTVNGIDDPPGLPIPVPTPGTIGRPQWKHKNVYRTLVAGSGFVNYYKIKDKLPLGTFSWADTMTTAEASLKPPLESVSWVPPPPQLEGFIAMPNGFLIGFKGKDLFFSEAYHYHAWPFEYKYTVEHEVVGLGRIDTTCVVATEGYPYSITGMKPSILSFNKANTNEPCLSRGSIISTPYGVLYASPNGLMSLGPQGFTNATEKIMTRSKWMQDFTPSHLRCARFGNGYLALRDIPEPNSTLDKRSIFYFDQTDLKVALTEMQDYGDVINVVQDIFSGEVLLLATGAGDPDDNVNFHEVQRWDPIETDEWKPVQWKSKEFQFPFKENFSAYCIYWDEARFSTNEDCDHIMSPSEHVRFIVYADRQVIYDQPVPIEANGKPVRLPSGFKADIWQFEIKSRAPVYSIHIASTVKELKSV